MEKIREMLASKDKEMVELGCVLMRKFPRKEWKKILLANIDESLFFTIRNNKIFIDEKMKEVSQSYSYMGQMQSYTMIVANYCEMNVDYDEQNNLYKSRQTTYSDQQPSIKKQLKPNRYESKRKWRKQAY